MVKHIANCKISLVTRYLCAAALLASCSGIKTYRNTPDNNLQVRTDADSNSFFSSVRAAVDIHQVGTDCSTQYEGTVQLRKPMIDIGIPSNRWSRLVFVFASSSFWANRRGTITYETLIKPRAGFHYEADVTYKDDMYNVTVRETQSGSRISREIERKDLRACMAK